MAPFSLGREAIWEMRNPLALPPLWGEAAFPLCTFPTSSQTHSFSYVQLCGELTKFLSPPPTPGARAWKGTFDVGTF